MNVAEATVRPWGEPEGRKKGMTEEEGEREQGGRTSESASKRKNKARQSKTLRGSRKSSVARQKLDRASRERQ